MPDKKINSEQDDRGFLMQALLLEGPRQLKAKLVPWPRPRPGEELVTVEVTGIGGSECAGFITPGIRPIPSIMGHGIAGTVTGGRRVAVNPLGSCGHCVECQRGMRQLCSRWSLIGVQVDGGLAEAVAVPIQALAELPDTLSWEQAAFAEPFANAVNAWELAAPLRQSVIAIIGAGGLGPGLTACAEAVGCRAEVADLSSSRLEAAATLGATHTASALAGAYDVVFDTVGSTATRDLALALTRPGGSCVLLGFADPRMDIDAGSLIRSQKRVIGSFVYSDRQFREALVMAERCLPTWVDALTFDQVKPYLERCLSGDFATVKAALMPRLQSELF